jgi:broad specificity phosphatase PhoE
MRDCVPVRVGACDGMTYEEIEENFPEEFARRGVDKLAYRYPRYAFFYSCPHLEVVTNVSQRC